MNRSSHSNIAEVNTRRCPLAYPANFATPTHVGEIGVQSLSASITRANDETVPTEPDAVLDNLNRQANRIYTSRAENVRHLPLNGLGVYAL